MALLVHCPHCNNGISPGNMGHNCPFCNRPIPQATASGGTQQFTGFLTASLTILEGGYGNPVNVSLPDGITTYVIGRGRGATGALIPLGTRQARINIAASAAAVASDHARLDMDLTNRSSPICRFTDLKSTNGSFRNSLSFHAAVLEDGDELWLGPIGHTDSVRIIYHDPDDRPPMKRLVLTPPGARGVPDPLEIGRDVPPGHLKLFSEKVSGLQAVINRSLVAGKVQYILTARTSLNSTYVNNRILAPNQSHVLKEGDLVALADCQYGVKRLDAVRLALVPLGAQASQHITGVGLVRSVRTDANIWLRDNIRYWWRRIMRTMARRNTGGTALVPPQTTRNLLQDIDVVVGPNDFVILVGSSGCGKTTLMHVLSTFIHPQAGTLFYKGQPYKDAPQILRPHIGYVPQDDIVHEQLTLIDELKFAAELRLSGATLEERERRIQRVLKQLRLVPQARQRINKLSGGQRKRVSIAVELLSQPGILFLDEPTEGQDLALEQSIIVMLRNLCNDGTSVILVSHRLNFLDYVDYVGWLAPGGHLAYFGPPDQIAPYFGINRNLAPARCHAEVYDLLYRDPNPAQWAAKYKQSPEYNENIKARLQPTTAQPQPIAFQVQPGVFGRPPAAGALSQATHIAARASSPRAQFKTLFRRDWAVVRADWAFLVWMIAQAPLIGLILNVLADPDMFKSAQEGNILPAQQLLFPLAVSAIWLGVFGSMRELVKERAIYRRERMVGLALGPYIASKIAVLSTFSVYQSIVLLWMVLSKANPVEDGVFLPAPLEMFITVLLTSFGGMALGLLLSALARTQEVVGALVPLVVIPQFMLSKALGFSLTGVMDVISKLMFTNWSLEALGDSAHLSTGPEYTGNSYDPSNGGHLITRWLMLLGISFVLLALTWVRQKQRDKYQG